MSYEAIYIFIIQRTMITNQKNAIIFNITPYIICYPDEIKLTQSKGKVNDIDLTYKN